MAVGVGFHRARLRYAYMLMRGKNLQTGEITEEGQKKNLDSFRQALDLVMDVNNWHGFVNLFLTAGYLKREHVASANAVVFSYILYLTGKYEYKVPALALKKIMTKWIFMSMITSMYSSSAESIAEKQFADLRGIHHADEFIAYLDSAIHTQFTEDYFNVTLPQSMSTSYIQSPVWYGYLAALNVLGTPMWLSTEMLVQYLVPGVNGTKSAIEKHHIFPKNYLELQGYSDGRDQNQIANYTYIDYATNIDISDDPPAEYIERYRKKLGEDAYRLTCAQNALPEDFYTLDYPEFLARRRGLMAGIIRKAYEKLCRG